MLQIETAEALKQSLPRNLIEIRSIDSHIMLCFDGGEYALFTYEHGYEGHVDITYEECELANHEKAELGIITQAEYQKINDDEKMESDEKYKTYRLNKYLELKAEFEGK